MYVLEPGDRIYEAVEMAGGMTADAGTCAVNLAESVYDGLMVYIPDSEEAAGMTGSMTSAGGTAVSGTVRKLREGRHRLRKTDV